MNLRESLRKKPQELQRKKKPKELRPRKRLKLRELPLKSKTPGYLQWKLPKLLDSRKLLGFKLSLEPASKLLKKWPDRKRRLKPKKLDKLRRLRQKKSDRLKRLRHKKLDRLRKLRPKK